MAVFKCKMCGAELPLKEGQTVAECRYCGTKQTLPKLDDERRANLYDRANHFRRNNEFDRAAGIYEQILAEDETDAEAYWSLVLCTYGIEYVEDPGTHKRKPTVNRAQYTSIFSDANYRMALEHADAYQRSVYEEEAKAIDEIQKGILAISQTEEPFDVFICYKETDPNGRRTPDSVLANDLYHQLTNEGFRVFFSRITLEDKLGTAYEPYIFAALQSAKVMVVLGTKPEYFNAVWVKNEWSRYLGLIKAGAKKTLIPAYRDMDAYDLPDEFSHLQAQDMSKLGFMQDLIRGIKKIVDDGKEKASPAASATAVNASSATGALLKRAYIFLEDGDFEQADEYCERVLDLDPECGEAYLVKLLAEEGCLEEDMLPYFSKEPLENLNNFKKATRFADDELQKRLDAFSAKWHQLKAEEEEKARQEKERQERELAEKKEQYTSRRQELVGLEAKLDAINKPVTFSEDADIATIQKELNAAKNELSGLGLFAGARKKQLAQDIETLKGRLSSVQQKAETQRKAVLAQRQAELIPLLKQTFALCHELKPLGQEIGAKDVPYFRDFSLGSYPQNGTAPEPIEWRVIAYKADSVLVISKKGLDCKQFNSSQSKGNVWETSDLKKWLTQTFLSTAFTAEEKGLIQEITCLSVEQAKTHFLNDNDRICKPTPYAVKQGAYVNKDTGGCSWWLRSPGSYGSGCVAYVFDSGFVNSGGWSVGYSVYAVRPALWLNL